LEKPVDSILDVARRTEADLIAMGTHGRTGLLHLALGSVAEAVIRRATCPVLVTKAAR
jgi:nucleotide-binding universal stress UspA family protein